MLYDADGHEIQQPNIFDPQGVTPTDAALLARMVAEIRTLDDADAPWLVAIPALPAVQLAGLLQLALRHDGTSGNIRETAVWFLDGVREYFADCPAVLEILRRGDDPAFDIHRPR